MQIIGADESVFNAMVFGEPPPQVQAYVQQQMAQAQTALGTAGQWLFNKAEQFYDTVRNDDALRIARAAFRVVESLWSTNEIKYLSEIHQVQNAPNVQVRWNMCEPTLRKLYQSGVSHGYGDRYIDSEPDYIGKDHLDYRLLMSGIGTIHDADDELDFSFTNYFQTVDDNEIELGFMQKVDILQTHEVIREAIRLNRDPASKYDMDLG
jgi:hypothetical protein